MAPELTRSVGTAPPADGDPRPPWHRAAAGRGGGRRTDGQRCGTTLAQWGGLPGVAGVDVPRRVGAQRAAGPGRGVVPPGHQVAVAAADPAQGAGDRGQRRRGRAGQREGPAAGAPAPPPGPRRGGGGGPDPRGLAGLRPRARRCRGHHAAGHRRAAAARDGPGGRRRGGGPGPVPGRTGVGGGQHHRRPEAGHALLHQDPDGAGPGGGRPADARPERRVPGPRGPHRPVRRRVVPVDRHAGLAGDLAVHGDRTVGRAADRGGAARGAHWDSSWGSGPGTPRRCRGCCSAGTAAGGWPRPRPWPCP